METDGYKMKQQALNSNCRITVKFYDAYMNVHPDKHSKETDDLFFVNGSTCWKNLLKQFPDIKICKLFTSLPEEKIKSLLNKAKQLDPSYKPANLLTYYSITCKEKTDQQKIMHALLKWEQVELAYINGRSLASSINLPSVNAILPQQYLGAAPEGINAQYAWKFEGGMGNKNVKFIDIEQGWHLDQELMNVETLPLTGINDDTCGEHGFAVLSVIMMKKHAAGYSGITPKTKGYVISQWRPDGSPNDADALIAAISYLTYGDIILLETQSYCAGTKNKLWPIEIQQACFEVIRLATALGIIIIEAAGNGDLGSGEGNDLDLFTLSEKKILNRGSDNFRDSNAIIVAAATPGALHYRLRYSNYGSRIDCYAWGAGVSAKEFYSHGDPHSKKFNGKLSGTSSAAAIIAGAAIIVQSIFEASHNLRLGPKEMRALLSDNAFGTASANGNDKIAVMPDLKKIIDNFLLVYPGKTTTKPV